MSRQIVLTGVDGSIWDLLTGDLQVEMAAPALWGMPPVTITERSTFAIPGSTVTNRRYNARDLVIPIMVIPDNPADVEDLIARFVRALDPLHGDVTIAVSRDNGYMPDIDNVSWDVDIAWDADVPWDGPGTDHPAREITATYLTGLDGLTIAWQGGSEATANVLLRATDPYWRSVFDETVSIAPDSAAFAGTVTGFNDPTIGFSDPNVPFNGYNGLGGGTVVFPIRNNGDVEVWPHFEVRGPASIVVVSNLTTGEMWRLPGGLAIGDVLSVETTPGQRSFRINGVNAYAQLTEDSKLFGFPRGASDLSVWINVPTVDFGSFVVSWTPRYLTC